MTNDFFLKKYWKSRNQNIIFKCKKNYGRISHPSKYWPRSMMLDFFDWSETLLPRRQLCLCGTCGEKVTFQKSQWFRYRKWEKFFEYTVDSKVDTKPCMRLFFFLPVLRVKSKSNLICCGICGIWPHFCSDGYLGLLSLLREYNKAPCRGLEPSQRDICLW